MTETYTQNACSIYDGMSILQNCQPPAEATFALVFERIFDLVTSCPSRRNDVVFDVYFDISIKSAEQCKRSSTPEGVRYKKTFFQGIPSNYGRRFRPSSGTNQKL